MPRIRTGETNQFLRTQKFVLRSVRGVRFVIALGSLCDSLCRLINEGPVIITKWCFLSCVASCSSSFPCC